MVKTKISFIFVNKDNTELILNAIKSVYRLKTKYRFEVIVADNNSNEDTILAIRKNFTKAKIIMLKNNFGSAAFNYALQKCNGEYIYFSPGDVEFKEDFLDPLVEFLDNNKTAAQASPKLMSIKDKDMIDMAGTWVSRSFYVSPFKDNSLGNKITEIPYMGTGLIRKSFVNQWGYLFDKDYFFYGEDVELGLRIILFGYKVYYFPHSIVYHAGSIERGKLHKSYHLTFLMERNLLRTFLTSLSPKNIILLLPYVLSMRFVAVIKDMVTLKFNNAIARIYSILWIIFNFNLIMKKRKIIQKMRKVEDKELFRLFSEKYLFKI